MAKQTYNLFQKHDRFAQTDPVNPGLQWNAYIDLERQVFAAWAKLQKDVKRGASPEVLLEDKNRLMLLLGECNYLAHEYMRWVDYKPQAKPTKAPKSKRKKR